MATSKLDPLMATQANSYVSGDLGPFLDAFASDATILPSTSRSLLRGAKNVRRFITTNAQRPNYTMQVIKSEVGSDMAYQLIRYRGKNTNKKNKTAYFSGFLTRVLRREGDEWKIVHAMWKDL